MKIGGDGESEKVIIRIIDVRRSDESERIRS